MKLGWSNFTPFSFHFKEKIVFYIGDDALKESSSSLHFSFKIE